jgi:hypothetical protein
MESKNKKNNNKLGHLYCGKKEFRELNDTN